MATVVDDFPTFTYTPTDEELEWERQYWADMDRIAEYEAYFVAQAEAQEHGYSDDCDCDACCEYRADSEELEAQDREYERAIRGY